MKCKEASNSCHPTGWPAGRPMNTKEAWALVGGLSKPSKMPGWSIGLPAKECKTGGKLQAVKGSVCYDCYALKGCYVFKVVQDAQYKRLAAITNPLWVGAMALLISHYATQGLEVVSYLGSSDRYPDYFHPCSSVYSHSQQ